MAKSKKKLARRERKGRLPDKGGSQYGSSDDESFDTMSVMSVDSTVQRVSQENVSVEEDALTEQYFFEDRLRDCIEGALETKGSPRRWMCLDALCKGLADKYSPDFLGNRPATMTELLEKSMRRGKVEEQVTAATLAAVLVLQYGASPEGAEIQRTLFKIFITNLKDESQPPHLREKIAAALAITTLIAEEEVPNTHEVMEQFTAIFSKSCRRGEVKAIPPNLTPAEVKLHQTALQSWGLLLTVAEDRAYHLIDRNLATVTALLHSSDVDVRVAAGEVLAMMYEIARDHDSDFEGDDLEKLCEDLHMLATDSKRYRAKKERKYQRASFREIERAVRDGDKPDFNIQFGMETLKVRTWEDKRTYDAVCGILGSGMHHHLQLNPEVRTLFGLGAPLAICANLTEKLGKYERIVADRARTKRLAKCRDKRVFQFD